MTDDYYTTRNVPNNFFLYWGATSPDFIGYWSARELLIVSLVMWRIGSTLKATIHYSNFRASIFIYRLLQTAVIKLREWLLRQLNMVFSRLNILSRVARMRITASLTFGHKNTCGQLQLFASYSEVFDVAWCTKCHNEVKITALTEKKLCLQITWIIGNVSLCMRSHVWRMQLPISANDCRKENCVVYCGF